MNITPQSYNVPIQTAVNVQTDSLRRDNQQREIITKPEALNQSAAEKGVASDKERGRTPAQVNEQVDFTNLRKLAEQANNEIDGAPNNGERSGGGEQNTDENQEQTNQKDASENQEPTEHNEQSDAEILSEQKEIRSLEQRDQEVRTHEQAHAGVGGSFTGAPSYSFETGPNGKRYAVEGKVSVDLSVVAGSPEKTIAKMKKVQAAALAPAEPSAQDLRVAASAANAILEAQAELAITPEDEENSDNKSSDLFRDKRVFNEGEVESNQQSKEFDQLIEQTLTAQNDAVPRRSLEVDQRAGRIEQFYSNINQAYEKPPSFQFELTA